MSPKNLFFLLAIILAAAAIALICLNMAIVPVTFVKTTDMPLGGVVAIAYAMGLLTCYCVWSMQKKEKTIEQKKLEWKTEDAKLQTEIQSDKVHQLELQVKTLESALDKALKRSKS